LIDVREQFEHDIANIGGKLIPLGKIKFHLDEIEKDKQVVIYCRSGRRSAEAVKFLEEATGHLILYNLKGGILAWAAEIDEKVSILL
jgi:adenylyltransferase/sulfurtransferase